MFLHISGKCTSSPTCRHLTGRKFPFSPLASKLLDPLYGWAFPLLFLVFPVFHMFPFGAAWALPSQTFAEPCLGSFFFLYSFFRPRPRSFSLEYPHNDRPSSPFCLRFSYRNFLFCPCLIFAQRAKIDGFLLSL